MTIVATKRFALSLTGVAGVLAALTAIALISALFTAPERVAAAMGEGDAQALFALVSDRLMTAVRVLVRYL